MVPHSGIQYEREGPIAYVTIDRPEKQNSYTPEMRRAFAETLNEADEDEDLRAIIVTGAGERAFCTGADLGEMIPEMTDGEMDPHPDEGDLMQRRRSLTTPLIAAVNGVCVGGGMEFLQTTDIRIAEEDARFGLQEPRWGLVPASGSHVRLPRQIPYCKAMEYILTGDLFPAEHAVDAGLVNEVVPEGQALSRAEEVAESIAENSSNAVQTSKAIVTRCLGRPLDEAFRLETDMALDVFDSEDAREGPRAFLEDREPSFRPGS